MQYPTTGAQMAKDFDKLHKNTNPPKSCALPSSSICCSDLLSHCNLESPSITLAIVAAPLNAAAHTATLKVICTNATIMKMIITVTNPLTLAMKAIILLIVMISMERNPFLISQDMSLLGMQPFSLMSYHMPMDLIILPGTKIQMTVLIILFILTVVDIL